MDKNKMLCQQDDKGTKDDIVIETEEVIDDAEIKRMKEITQKLNSGDTFSAWNSKKDSFN